MMDLFDSITEKPEQKSAGPELFDQIGESAPTQDLFDMVPGGPEAEKPPAPVPWEETTPGVLGEITKRAPIGMGPLGMFAPYEKQPMPTIGKVYEKPFIEEPSYWEKVKAGAKGVGEAALSLTTGLAAMPFGQIAEAGALISRRFPPSRPPQTETVLGPEGVRYELPIKEPIVRPEDYEIGYPEGLTPKQARERIAESLTYEPKTELGQEMAAGIGKVVGLPFWAAEKLREWVEGKWGTEIGSAVGLSAEIATMAAAGVAGAKIRKTKAAIPEQVKEVKPTEIPDVVKDLEPEIKRIERFEEIYRPPEERQKLGEPAIEVGKKIIETETFERAFEKPPKGPKSKTEFADNLTKNASDIELLQIADVVKYPIETAKKQIREAGQTENLRWSLNQRIKNLPDELFPEWGKPERKPVFLGLGPVAQLQKLYEKIFPSKTTILNPIVKDILPALRDAKIEFGEPKQLKTGRVQIPLLSEGEEIGGLKIGRQGNEYVISAIGRYERATDKGKGVPTQTLKAIMDEADRQGFIVRAKNAERAGGYYAELGFEKEGHDFIFNPQNWREILTQKIKEQSGALTLKDFTPEERTRLQNDLLRIGDMEKEGPAYVKGLPEDHLQDIAAANRLPFTKNRKNLEDLVIHYAQRAALNIRHRAKPEILGLGSAGELQKVYEILTKQRRRTDPLPKYARSINLERQDIKEGYKEFQADLAELMPEKKVQTWDQSQKLADEILRDYSKITDVYKKVERGAALNTEEILAARTVNITAINRLAEIAQEKSPEVVNRYLKTYADRVFKLTSEASSEAGRALNIHKKFVAPARIAEALGKLKNGMNERQFKEFQEIAPLLSKDFEGLTEIDMGKVQKFIERLPDPKLGDYFYEFWYNSILSGIPTHVVNFASNTLWQAWNIMIHHPIASGLDAVISRFTGRERQLFFSEVFPMLAGIKSGIKKGWEGVKEVIRTGEATNFQNKWDRDVGSGVMSAFERSPNATLRAMAPYITMSTRALKAMDVWANSIAFDAKMNGLIHREGLKRGLEGDALTRFEQKFKPTDEMIDESAKYAQYITFMEDPGPMNQLIMKARNTVWGGRLFVPFVNTIGNLLKRGIEMTPGVGLTLAKGKPIHEVLAKQIEGSIISLWLLNKAFNGEVTGGVPDTPAEKEAFFRQKKLPWSVRIGDTWYQYRRFEPLNTVLASTAIVYDKLKHAKSQADAASIFFDCARGVWENLLDSSYLSGAIQMFQKHGNLASVGFRQTASLVPFSGFWRSVNRAVEAIAEDNAMVRESKSFMGAISQVIPGLYKLVEPKLDLWGEKVILPGNAFRQWLPYKWSEAGTDQVESELERLMIYPAQPQKTMAIGDMKIEIPEDFYRDYALHFGMVAKRRLEKVLTSPGYGQARDEQKTKIIDHELRSIREIELMRAKREYIKRFGQPAEELNLKRRITG